MKTFTPKSNDYFGDFYTQTTNYFGDSPSDGLVAAIKKYNIPPGRVLDIGAGEGRNAIYLLKNNFDVDALEPSISGVNKIKERATAINKKIHIFHQDYLSFTNKTTYDFILAATSIDHIESKYIPQVFKKLKDSLNPGAFVYIVVFTQEDPGYIKDTTPSSECAPYVKHYFKKNELLNYFKGYDILFYDEYQKEDRTHGPPHFHGKAKLIAKKIQ
jgi:cyclopropane fatty-acyl-phospholipid synthase-like methyltransferase